MKPSLRLRVPLLAAILLVVVTGAGVMGMRRLGSWLVLNEPLQHAQAIAVLGGGVPYRAMEAARLYQAGWAPQVWLSRSAANDGDRALQQIGMDAGREEDVNRAILLHMGVPESAIHVIPQPVENTVTELKAIAACLNDQPSGNKVVMLVSSKYHARRLRVIWNLVSGAPRRAVVRFTPEDPYNAAHWWRTTNDELSTFREVFGVVNAWVGFPVAPGR